MKRLAPLIPGFLVVGAFGLLLWLERLRPVRRRVEPALPHHVRNFAIGATGALAVIAIETPVVRPLAHLIQARRWGSLGTLQLPFWAEAAVAIVLMDYSFYLWHVLLHRVPLLWRFHVVHHVDLDLDTSTAIRFHFGELAISVPWRAAQVLAIGLTPSTFAMWQVWFAACVMFHHSNIRLPIQWERSLNRVFVTPRMHGIHHSNKPDETNSNWSSGLTVWDWLHRTLRLEVPQAEIVIGIPAFSEVTAVELKKVLVVPFCPQPDYWRFPDNRTDRE